jgi:hypothetical protein
MKGRRDRRDKRDKPKRITFFPLLSLRCKPTRGLLHVNFKLRFANSRRCGFETQPVGTGERQGATNHPLRGNLPAASGR